MMPPTPVRIPLINPNEPEASLAALHVQPGQHVAMGDLLCTLETTKSASEVQAEAEGYVVGLRFQNGDSVRAGDILCYLADSPDWTPPETELPSQPAHAPDQLVPEGLRITQPALALARQHHIDLTRLPADRLITESILRAHLAELPAAPPEFTPPTPATDSRALIIYGGGGHAKALIDLIRARGGYRIVGVLDDNPAVSGELLGVPILGGAEQLIPLYDQGVRQAVNAVGGIGDVRIRIQIFERLAQAGFAFPNMIHPRALLEPSAALSAGGQIFPLAYVGSEAQLGFGAIINSGAIISHECVLGDYVNISPGAILAGQVWVGSGALIGMGATVNLQVKIGAGARIGNGATVKSDVPAGGVVRAGAIWPA
jgi:sugar O-acyltransferase (sialic acid O-acetyltransferase NeuD family)